MSPPRLLAALAAAALCGCGAPGEKLLPVSGMVLVEGRPVKNASVSFRRDASRGNASRHIPTGVSNADGKYELMTAGRKGAPPGWYKVVVFADNFSADEPPPKGATAEIPKSIVNAKYLDANTTDLAVEVTEKPAEGAYTLKLIR